MKLRSRLFWAFAGTFVCGIAVLYLLSKFLVMSSFEDLEVQQMKQSLQYAEAAIEDESHQLGTITNDYAYWDRTYQFMADPQQESISDEFQDLTMEGLKLDLIVIRDPQGNVVFEKFYDARARQSGPVPDKFLREVFARPEMALDRIVRMPRDGLLDFSDGIRLISVRPILSSQRTGEPRGTLFTARRFDETNSFRIGALFRTSVDFQRMLSTSLSSTDRVALASLLQTHDIAFVQPLTQNDIAGYTLLLDVFDEPLLLLRVNNSRPIYERGRFSQLYIFLAVFLGTVLACSLIFFLLQRFVLSRLGSVNRQITSIGKRKAITERVTLKGDDELGSLAASINGMLGELERTESHFLFLTENIQQIFWVKDARTGNYEYVSPAFETILGRSTETVLRDPNSWQDLVLAEDSFLVQRMGEQQARGAASEAYFRVLSKDGTLHWVWERSFPAFAADGHLRQIIGLTEDISDFKRNEEALLEAQQELELRVEERTRELAERGELVKLLVDSTTAAMYCMDAAGIITFCNPAALQLLGYQHADDVFGRMSHQLLHHSRNDGSPYPVEECPIFASFREGKDAHVADEVFWRKDGTSFPVEYDSRKIRRDGRVVGVVVSFADLSERRLREMQLRHSQKLEDVGRLAAGIAHEINTPIQFISDNTRFLQNSFTDGLKLIHAYQRLHACAAAGSIDPALLDFITTTCQDVEWPYLEKEIPLAMSQMLEGLDRVSTIVRGMKEFSHVDRSNQKSPGDLNHALESTLIVARNELKFVADVETQFANLPPVLCHLGDMNQVFLNLLVNASHAIQEVQEKTGLRGKIIVQTRLDGDDVIVSISDTGPGIPDEARDKIFDSFFTTKGLGKGTGQGLALARAIVVEKHGGKLTFETQVGKGTTFIVRLPVSGSAVREEALTP